MAITIPPPPRTVPEFNEVWKDWLWYMWKQTKGGEEGQTDGGDANAIHDNRDGEILLITEKTTPADADLVLIEDSATSYSKKRMTFTNLRAGVLTFLDNEKILFGNASDGSIYYDGTNLVINPKEVGSGVLDVLGTVRSDGRIEETASKTANYTAVATDENIVCDTSGGAFTVTMPASPETGRTYTVILETAGNILTVAGNGNTINGDTTMTMGQAGWAMQLMYNGTQWSIK